MDVVTAVGLEETDLDISKLSLSGQSQQGGPTYMHLFRDSVGWWVPIDNLAIC